MANTEQDPYAPPQYDSIPINAKYKYMDYETIQPNSVLRACSRKQLQGVWLQMAMAFLVFYLIVFPPTIIFPVVGQFYNQTIGSFFSIVVSIIAGPFVLGFVGYFIKRVRDEEISIGNIFSGFKRFIPSVMLMFFMYLFICLWSILLVIPGLIKAFSYSMAFFIMYDDPEIKPLEALKKSQKMMKGYKGKLFILFLSFFGWIILTAFTMGIGYLWLAPYVYLSVANFYENLKISQEKA